MNIRKFILPGELLYFSFSRMGTLSRLGSLASRIEYLVLLMEAPIEEWIKPLGKRDRACEEYLLFFLCLIGGRIFIWGFAPNPTFCWASKKEKKQKKEKAQQNLNFERRAKI